MRRYRGRLTGILGVLFAGLTGFALVGALGVAVSTPAAAQSFTYNPVPSRPVPPRPPSDGQMLVQATEVDYDYNKLAGVGGRQRPDVFTTGPVSRPTRSSTTRRPSGFMPKAISA